ncbi:uncharacterized protein LOC135194219 [Vanessa tameamea]|uniref:Uncharacterized protein LOC135194219 n=1 Tax=Vanessa tameamea TaxID=334116 RepID=A0ABM4AVZ5_VANTA
MSNNYLTDTKAIADRFKRSASKRQRKHNKDGVHKNLDKDTTNDVTRTESRNNTGVTRVWIKDEQIFIKYVPERRRNFPKCSHSHETKYHERKLKHPFYKNSQRIDEMLYEKKTTKNVKAIEQNTKDNTNLNKVKNVNRKGKKLTDKDNVYDIIEDIVCDEQDKRIGYSPNETDFNKNIFMSTPPAYRITLIVSTLMSPISVTEMPQRKYTPVERPGHRRLMQVDDEEDKEDLVYEDLKEVLEDEGQSQDDIDKQVERNKRDDKFDPEPLTNPSRYSAQNTHNINWKGPMPLYPDEINAAIKQMTIQNMNQFPLDTKDMKSEKERAGKDVSDTEYIENYADNKYNKMLKMAQAYSDYGVLYGKKDRSETMKDSDENGQYNKLKPYINKESLLDRFFRRSKKGSYEGFSFQRKQGETKDKEEFMKSLTKHIKFIKNPNKNDNCKKLNEISKETHYYVTPDNEKQTGNAIFTWKKGSRSLKSIEVPDNVNETDEVIHPLIDGNNSGSNDNKISFSTDGMLSLISVLSDWLISLPYLSSNDKIEESKKNISDSNQNSRYNATKIKAGKILRNVNDTQDDFNYPSYDSETVDNIGHRSRVLMSIEDKRKVNRMPVKNDLVHTSTETDSIIPVALVLVKNDKENITKHKDTHVSNNIQLKNENKTIVKRNAEHRQSVFWNDLYDDEYGVKIDYTENIRDKHSAKKGQNVVRQSRDWFQNRFKNFTSRFKVKFLNKSPILSKNTTASPSTSVNAPKRPVRQTSDNADADIKKSFADLTENMKKVCQEAVRAVQDTKNIEVREEKKEDGAATSLMQQLVRLMTDLVDIQVQQKNCAKLPSDLYKFLEWLTVPQDTNADVDEVFPGQSYTIDDSANRYEKSTYPSYDVTLTEDTHQEDRTECLGTIRAVQDLIQQYEGMSDEDKSKMTGVKEYLENQLKFLNRKLNGSAETNLYELHTEHRGKVI